VQKKNWNVVKNKYKEFITLYGIYPILHLLKEYEETQKFDECAIIFESMTEFIDEVKRKNKKVAKDLHIPTHLDQITPELFDKLRLDESDKYKNAKTYTKKIKQSIEHIYNGL